MRIFIAGLFMVMISSTMMISTVLADPLVLDWDNLIPSQGQGKILFVPDNSKTIGTPKRENFEGSDEEYAEMLDLYESQRYMQLQGVSIRSDLDGKTVRIPGFITPLEVEGDKVVEFLLVPYVGACIHVPSPPGNQIIYVSKIKGIALDKIYDPVWITGKLRATPLTTILAEVGYHMEGVSIEPYLEQ